MSNNTTTVTTSSSASLLVIVNGGSVEIVSALARTLRNYFYWLLRTPSLSLFLPSEPSTFDVQTDQDRECLFQWLRNKQREEAGDCLSIVEFQRDLGLKEKQQLKRYLSRVLPFINLVFLDCKERKGSKEDDSHVSCGDSIPWATDSDMSQLPQLVDIIHVLLKGSQYEVKVRLSTDRGAYSSCLQHLISFLVHCYPYGISNPTFIDEQDSSKLWVVVHGESEYNKSGRIGGDSKLTSKGEQFAKSLSDWILSSFNESDAAHPFYILSSELKRSTSTAESIINHVKSHPYFKKNPITLISTKELNEISAGDCDGMTYKEIEENMRDVFEKRSADKLQYRYPGATGESYLDVVERVNPVVLRILSIMRNRKARVLVVGHQAVVRVLYAYFSCYQSPIQKAAIPHISLPSNSLFEFCSNSLSTVPIPPQQL